MYNNEVVFIKSRCIISEQSAFAKKSDSNGFKKANIASIIGKKHGSKTNRKIIELSFAIKPASLLLIELGGYFYFLPVEPKPPVPRSVSSRLSASSYSQ